MPSNLIDAASLSEADVVALRDAVAEVQAWLRLKISTGRYSFGFVVELAQHNRTRGYNTHAIYDEIGKLEGTDSRPSLTKPAAPLTGPLLRGLWHKHHHQAGFLSKNITNEFKRKGALQSAMAPHFGRYVHEVAGEVAHAMVVDTYERRAIDRRMTGEWIVFEQANGVNYYLTLGSHNEDEDILRRVSAYRQVDRELASRRC